ncbi:NAD/NADP-dependent octopine/nopaline dehydrogenase family protein [Paracraurococcus ruber]|uniref:2-dehydropantoate 2-reductase n=1 Tax=Paracraurococcus ruber TaxID=77675 RepID=A0ABS1CRF3_9PROT|nr:NAD/NADP-dependent octopine/nopaline dehydrogenase family protein [Paracraurococcus ruber]MBK1657009.1 NAD/NADP octopine/nopaline dehydrogenase [Paracraurococcus ruber]TDG34295.1 NAD/NADP octopine/nopaline dehydrogenase [Paracraurococcus ruber]
MRVAVLGGGAIGLGMAAFLAENGHRPVVWSRSGAPAVLEVAGALTGHVPLEVAPGPAAAVTQAEAVVLALPANHHRAVLDAVAPHLGAGQAVILSGHLSFGALYLARLLAARGVMLPIIALGTTVVTGRRTGPGAVRIGSIRAQVDLATLPVAQAEAGLALCRALCGDRFRLRDGLLAIALSNVNPQNHMGIALCNLTRMERSEDWRQNDNITDAVGRLLEALDAERLAIAGALGLGVRTLRQHFALSFHVPEAPLGEMARAMAARGDNPQAPATLDTRYVLEDVPFGLMPTARLGRLVGRPAPLHEAGIALLSALYGRDLAAANDLLPGIGFDDLSLPRLQALCRDGWCAA